MTMQLVTPAMSAHNPTDSEMTIQTSGEEVKTVAIFESRPARVTRVWDEMSEIDRAVLLEAVRQRRKAELNKQRHYAEIYNLRRFR